LDNLYKNLNLLSITKKKININNNNLDNLYKNLNLLSITKKKININNNNLDNLYKNLYLYNRTRINFIFNNTIIFCIYRIIYSKINISYLLKNIFKKKIFSFIYPNEIKNAILKKKKFIFLNKFLYNLNFFFKKLKPSSFFFLKKYYKFYFKLNLQNYLFNQASNVRSKLLPLTQQVTKAQTINSFNKTYPYQTIYNNLYNHFTFEQNLINDNEVKIPRIRFKPGYQRLWRQARTALKELLKLKFTYQQQLTKYLTRFYK
jgi:hypothetical protein